MFWFRPPDSFITRPGLSFSISENCSRFNFCRLSPEIASTDIGTDWMLSFRFDAVMTTSWISPGFGATSCAITGNATASAAAHHDSLMQ
ncbi:hypothetical protein IA69_15395 [Massilia sp. JS1662]|nr:hypothetical protein IA69_15395 [Massilia sp. JS1662]